MATVTDTDTLTVAGGLRVTLGLLTRRLRQVPAESGLTLSETSALARLEREGPRTGSALARLERIRPQSMGAILTSLEGRGFVERRPDPSDGRQMVVSITKSGTRTLWSRRNDKTERLAQVLATQFTPEEIDELTHAVPLLERLAQSI
ncbi:MAG TPA: MarR family transcriptional regulator [Acidimicrobiia bacterium]|jgi:DNA-binding MarR family transcriptional regulator